jgi:tRNA A-37 threonylcarbamoyl transferase component Bud32
VTQIEREEIKRDTGKRLRVPHPHFFFKNERIQCYAMQQIQGVTLEELMSTETLPTAHLNDLRSAAWKSLSARYQDHSERHELEQELPRFMGAVHEVCIHGDIKFKNIMVSESGDIFLIDFGQSVPLSDASEKTASQFENLKQEEIGQLRECMLAVFNTLNTLSDDDSTEFAQAA